MDTIDQNILDMLRQNSRIPVNELAMQVHLTPPAVSARIKKLQADGTIRSFTIQLNDEIENKGIYHIIYEMLPSPGAAPFYSRKPLDPRSSSNQRPWLLLVKAGVSGTSAAANAAGCTVTLWHASA